MKSNIFPHWLICKNDELFIDFLFRWCMNHNMQKSMNHNKQEWIARHVFVSFDMVQCGSISDRYWIYIIFTFLYPHMAEKILFLDQIAKIEFLINLHAFRSYESECQSFSKWSVSVYAWMSAIRVTQKLITSGIAYLIGIMHLYSMEMLHETFCDDRANGLHIVTHKGFQYIIIYRRNFLFMHFNINALH